MERGLQKRPVGKNLYLVLVPLVPLYPLPILLQTDNFRLHVLCHVSDANNTQRINNQCNSSPLLLLPQIAKELNLIIGELEDNAVYEGAEIHAEKCQPNCLISKTKVKTFYGMGEVYAKDYKEFLAMKVRTQRELNLLDAMSRFYMGFWEGEYGAFQDYALSNFEL
ncbi:hypothetical protein L596_028897 [Steinernema carpocapsae]|uniref:Uncharacterized protein n=1 Tax=Steinernema carpocapsae TaxID=34508 RepID=A0A4U5LZU4_STECR|nr:hypothetical protein L596_028897 [Steinernema carpocapsae]